MSFAGAPFAASTFAGVAGAGVAPAPPEVGGPPETVVSPFTVELDGIAYNILANSLRIDTQLGRQGEASFDLPKLAVMPAIGHGVKIRYFSELIFAGAVDRVEITTDPSEVDTVVSCACIDYSYLLFRQKVKKTYTNQTLTQIANNLASNYLFYDGVTVGTVDVATPIPVADANWVSIFEFLSELATAVGAVFYVDYDKRLQFISTSIESSVTPLTASLIESISVGIDRETYRNRQTTTVIGTPSVEGQDALTVELTRDNTEQIAERALLEQTGGIYNEHVAVTHPTSNDVVQLTKLAQASNKIGLGFSGSLRRSLSIRTRQYGYRAGQFVDVTLDSLGVNGTWVIERMQVQEHAGLFLVATLELSQSSLRRRSQELWLELVRNGTVAVLPPSAVYVNQATFTTPGLGSWQVPVGVTEVQVTCYGGGGGGGGGARSEWPGYGGVVTANGSRGGSGGIAISILTVTPGTVLTFWVGAAGVGGAGQYRFQTFTDAIGAEGTNGMMSYVDRGGVRVGQANGGIRGIGGLANARLQISRTLPDGLGGNGLYATVVTIGGAANGGAGGVGVTNGAGANGLNGRVVVEW